MKDMSKGCHHQRGLENVPPISLKQRHKKIKQIIHSLNTTREA